MLKWLTSLICIMVCLSIATPAHAVAMGLPQLVLRDLNHRDTHKEFITIISTAKQEAPPAVAAVKPVPTAAKPVKTEQTQVNRGINSDVRQVLTTALSLMDKPYVIGGNGPNTFDCSGYTTYVYKQHGISLPRTADAQIKVGVPVSKDQLIAGDLVFFGYYNSRDVRHVGIYLGDGTFIHASSSNNRVIITSLSSNYFVTNYKGATRLIR